MPFSSTSPSIISMEAASVLSRCMHVLCRPTDRLADRFPDCTLFSSGIPAGPTRAASRVAPSSDRPGNDTGCLKWRHRRCQQGIRTFPISGRPARHGLPHVWRHRRTGQAPTRADLSVASVGTSKVCRTSPYLRPRRLAGHAPTQALASSRPGTDTRWLKCPHRRCQQGVPGILPSSASPAGPTSS